LFGAAAFSLFFCFLSAAFSLASAAALSTVSSTTSPVIINVNFVDAIRHLDVEGIDQTSFFAFNLFRLNFAPFLGQGGLLRLLRGDLRFLAQGGMTGVALAGPCCQAEQR